MVSVDQIYLYGKVFIAFSGAVSVVYGLIKWLAKTFNEVKSTNENVTLLMTNHLPHIQLSLNEHGETLKTITSDVRDVGTKVEGLEQRLDDTKRGVGVLGESFLRHLESASRETTEMKAVSAENAESIEVLKKRKHRG